MRNTNDNINNNLQYSLANLDLTGPEPVRTSESLDSTEKPKMHEIYVLGKHIQIAIFFSC